MAITLVQQVFSYATTGGTLNKTVTIATPGSGNTLVLMAQTVTDNPITAVTGGGVTWTKVASWQNAAVAGGEIWIGPNSSGSGTTITVTRTNLYGGRHDLNVSEWSGMPTTATADGGSNAVTNNPDNVTPSVTPTAGLPVLLLANNVVYTRTVTAGPSGGFTAFNVAGGSGYANFAYQVVAAASGSYQCGWTASAAYATSTAGLYAFDGTAGGGAPVAAFLPAFAPGW